MGLFVGSLVFQLFEKALGRISVICLSDVKAAPVPLCVWVCMVQKPKGRLLKKPKQASVGLLQLQIFGVLENTCIRRLSSCRKEKKIHEKTWIFQLILSDCAC